VGRIVRVFAIIALAVQSGRSLAAVTEIGQLHPFLKPGVTPGFEGIACDGSTNPIVLDRWAWTLSRVDGSSAAVLDSHVSNPVSSFNGALAYDAPLGCYYTTTGNKTLVRLDPDTGTHTSIGTSLGATFNFISLAVDPSDTLWLATDNAGAEQLWTVNKTTGVATLDHAITFTDSRQVTAMAIEPNGTFVVVANSGLFDERFYQVDPLTGNPTALGKTGIAGGQLRFMNSLTFDGTTGRVYGVEEIRSTTPYSYELVGGPITPEPRQSWVLFLTPSVLLTRPRASRR